MSDSIEALFLAVRNIVASAEPWADCLTRAVAFARANPGLLDDPAYWDRVAGHDFRDGFQKVAGWAREGLECLDLTDGWEFALLALGDCPEAFQLCGSGAQLATAETNFRNLVLTRATVDCTELERAAIPKWLWGGTHNVIELFDDVLSSGSSTTPRYHGSNGYFLWHVVASLALVAPLTRGTTASGYSRGAAGSTSYRGSAKCSGTLQR